MITYQMPLLDHERLSGHKEWRLAYMWLCAIGNGYIWQEGDKGIAKVSYIAGGLQKDCLDKLYCG